ncbi:sialin-like [Aphidius gifuensis]|uniref:sialin-like n=1 Tax=Aphidius gifuensis TaxID=684658 RepID=UPI001CDCBFC5|nr:sialin-like [Aphidius gifuensis]
MNRTSVNFHPQNISTFNNLEKNNNNIHDEDKFHWKFWKKRRYVVGLLAFFGFFVSYILRAGLSIAIVVMTTSSNKGDAEFDWDLKLQGLILSAFFYGYVSSQIFGGILSSKIGGKKVLGFGIGITALLTIITPPLTRTSVYLLIIVRVFVGICEGVTFPSMHTMWTYWAPPVERTRLATLSLAGSIFGSVFAMPMSGVIAQRFNWDSIFYIYGSLGVLWFFLWIFFVFDKPDDDPYISITERDYINNSLANDKTEKNSSYPWKSILTSIPFWAIVVSHFCESWGSQTMVTQLPIFMHDILKFETEQMGFVSALPFFGMGVVVLFSGHIADYLQSHNYLNTTQVRKVFTCGAFLGQTIFIVLAGFMTSTIFVVTCITIASTVGGFAWAGFMVNMLDIAPQHASILLGISTTISMVPGIISPVLTGYIVTNKTAEEWRIVFIIIAVFYIIGAFIFAIFASGKKQKWADNSNKQNAVSYYNSAMVCE